MFKGNNEESNKLEQIGIDFIDFKLKSRLTENVFLEIIDLFSQIRELTKMQANVIFLAEGESDKGPRLAACYLIFSDKLHAKDAIETVKSQFSLCLNKESEKSFVEEFAKSLNIKSNQQSRLRI